MANREDQMDSAVHDVVAAAALLEIVEAHLEGNAKACRTEDQGSDFDRRYALTFNEGMALDEAMNNCIVAANKLRKVYDRPDDVTLVAVQMKEAAHV